MKHSYESLFNKYRDDAVILKSKTYAGWTLPKLMAELSHRGSADVLERDYQEHGALLTNNLAAKLTALLFPSNRPFFGVEASSELLKLAAQKGITEVEFMSALARHEMNASQRVFLNSSYNQLTQAMAHLIVTGNVAVFRDSVNSTTVTYGLQSFSIRRTGRGELADAIVREYESFAGLTPELQMQLRMRQPDKYRETTDVSVAVYTRIRRAYAGGNLVYEVSQEIDSMPIGTPGQYPAHLCPWQFPVWALVAGEHYGRGLVEDYAGGFASLSDKSEALALYGIAAMKFVNLVTPGSGVVVEDIHRAETGEYVAGSNGAIQVQEAGQGQKIAMMRAEIDATFQNLARAFMYTGNTRQAERVTAFELRQQASEANTVLGGQYSALAESFQAPLGHVLLLETEPGLLEGIITEGLKVNIVSGIPALSRGIEVQNIIGAAQDAAAIVPALQQLDNRIDSRKLMDVIYAGQSVDTSRFLRTKEEQAEYDAAKAEEAQAMNTIGQSNALMDQQQALGALPG